jgi:hypothetical protein
MDEIKSKNIWLAIGLNLVYLGAGYFYMGRKTLGVLLMIIATGFAALIMGYPPAESAILTIWIGMFVVTCVDMLVLNNKIQKETTKPCPYCAEPIKKEAIFCLHCKKDLAVS